MLTCICNLIERHTILKPNILLLTGWGTSCSVWHAIIPVLKERFHITCIQPSWLPENTRATSLKNFDQYVKELAAYIDDATNIVAWSLGGLIAIRLTSLFPSLVSKIAFIASTPCFVNQQTNIGIDYAWFQQFMCEFEQKPRIVLKKFLTLQTKGDEFGKTTLQDLRKHCRIEIFNLDECRHGLNLLAQSDLSQELQQLSSPKIFIHGEGDAVLPIQAGLHAAKLADTELYAIPHAGHAPHVSHPSQVNELLFDYFE